MAKFVLYVGDLTIETREYDNEYAAAVLERFYRARKLGPDDADLSVKITAVLKHLLTTVSDVAKQQDMIDQYLVIAPQLEQTANTRNDLTDETIP